MCLPWRTSWYFWHPKGPWKIQEENEGRSVSQTCEHILSWRPISRDSCSLGLERLDNCLLRGPQRLRLTTQQVRTYVSDACQCTRWRKTGSSENQEEGRVGEKVLLLLFSQKKKKEKKNTYCCYFFKTWLCIMTAQCGKFRHFKKYDMKTFKSNSSPGNYGLQDLF